jgi:hypothetical protein
MFFCKTVCPDKACNWQIFNIIIDIEFLFRDLSTGGHIVSPASKQTESELQLLVSIFALEDKGPTFLTS